MGAFDDNSKTKIQLFTLSTMSGICSDSTVNQYLQGKENVCKKQKIKYKYTVHNIWKEEELFK